MSLHTRLYSDYTLFCEELELYVYKSLIAGYHNYSSPKQGVHIPKKIKGGGVAYGLGPTFVICLNDHKMMAFRF